MAAEGRDRHRELADRLFDAMEDELSAIVATEEGRSFHEYRYFYVPPNNAYKAGPVQSELSKPPSDVGARGSRSRGSESRPCPR